MFADGCSPIYKRVWTEIDDALCQGFGQDSNRIWTGKRLKAKVVKQASCQLQPGRIRFCHPIVASGPHVNLETPWKLEYTQVYVGKWWQIIVYVLL
jgi:hypothetical protein